MTALPSAKAGGDAEMNPADSTHVENTFELDPAMKVQCSDLLYEVPRSHRWKVHRNHRNVVPGTLFHRRQRGIPMHSYGKRSQIPSNASTGAAGLCASSVARIARRPHGKIHRVGP
jgi:hypothetical protein